MGIGYIVTQTQGTGNHHVSIPLHVCVTSIWDKTLRQFCQLHLLVLVCVDCFMIVLTVSSLMLIGD